MTVRTKENHSTKTKSDYNVLQFSFLNRPKELSPSYLEKNIFLKAEVLLVFEHVPEKKMNHYFILYNWN